MPSTATVPQTGFFGHPRGLATLFGTEMWERFSYYGMRAILLFYMYDQVSEGGLGMPQPLAAALVSVYGASIYLSAIAGGWVADRLIGPRHTVLYGGALIMCGHVSLALPLGRPALYASMAFLVVGTGLLKPNISQSVGALYPADDRRRDAGYSIFYMGISVGAVLSPFVVGTLGQRIGYHVGFGVAAVGMLIGLLQYVRGWKYLGDVGLRPANPIREEPAGRRRLGLIGTALAVMVLVVAVLALSGWLSIEGVVDALSVLAVVVPLAYFVAMLRSPKVSPPERARVWAFVPLFVASACFWLVQEQGYSVLATYADTRVALDAFGVPLASSWFQSVGSFVLIVLTPAFAVLWTRLGDRVSTPQKFAAGLTLAGMSYLLLVVPATAWGTSVPVGPLWLVASLAVVTVGEMCLSPIGMSATTRHAPAAFRSQTMGLWLASNAAGQGISAQIVQLYRPDTEATYFSLIGLAAIVLAAVLLALAPLLTRTLRRADAGPAQDEDQDENADTGGQLQTRFRSP
ncbi:peptide MFS transporter [Pseudonocardia adelaidensis]|uniref:Peptide MFS transporter n=1 Tax=Pseudonocardia adelaidensis TaxID=648754 RepID=A0ABP9NEX8_9PSEU